MAAAVEAASEHPVGRAIAAAAASRGLPVGAVESFRSHPGLGVEAMAQGERILAGSLRWLAEAGVLVPADVVADAGRLGEQGFSVVAVARTGQFLGLIALSDSVRPDARPALARLAGLGVRTWLLSGDSPGAVRRIASQLGMSDHAGGLLPKDKVDAVARLAGQSRGLAMVGDGINDAPALAAASVGIAIGRGGSDLAIEAADVVLLSNDLGRVADAIELGRRTLANIRFNIALSGVSIAGLFAAAAFGYVGPVAGALVHEGKCAAGHAQRDAPARPPSAGTRRRRPAKTGRMNTERTNRTARPTSTPTPATHQDAPAGTTMATDTPMAMNKKARRPSPALRTAVDQYAAATVASGGASPAGRSVCIYPGTRVDQAPPGAPGTLGTRGLQR